jgi:putative two-component system hydrogenase maturation factor HypX/HoxX
MCLLGGRDFWSNGIHLNVIEAADDPARESWRNINAIADLVLEILATRQLVVAGLRGNAGAGGVMLALAADQVFARRGVVLNPHYRSMGNLYGSEYWTHTLPRRVGADLALQLTTAWQPIGIDAGIDIGLIDAAFGTSVEDFERQLEARADAVAVPYIRSVSSKR